MRKKKRKKKVRTILGLKKFDHTHEGFTDPKPLKPSEINVCCLHILNVLML